MMLRRPQHTSVMQVRAEPAVHFLSPMWHANSSLLPTWWRAHKPTLFPFCQPKARAFPLFPQSAPATPASSRSSLLHTPRLPLLHVGLLASSRGSGGYTGGYSGIEEDDPGGTGGGGGGGVMRACAGSVATRGLLFANQHPAARRCECV